MLKTTHIRASLSQVLALIDEAVASEGYAPSAAALEPREVEISGEPITLDPEVPENVRRLVVAEKDGWVTIADHPFAETEWGEALSAALDAPAFTLEGECDHAFYSTIVVHEHGAIAHQSQVPEDAVHEADGRHRIRPTFLARHFPSATATLESGIVVNKLGGAENMAAVADALGLPNALLSPYDFTEEEGRAARLYERTDTQSIGASKLREGLAAMMGDLASKLGGAGVDLQALLGGIKAMATREPEPGLRAPSSSGLRGFVASVLRCHTTFVLDAATARGLTIRVSGSGIATYDITSIRAVSGKDVSAPGHVATPERDERGFFVHFDDVEMSPDDPEIVVYLEGNLVKEGKGSLDIRADIASFSATSENKIEVAPALRVPLLPDWFDKRMLQHREHDVAQYDAREAAVGWLAFDRPWADVREVVVRMMIDLSGILLDVARSEPQKRRVTLDPNAGHGEIIAAIKGGAEVTIGGSMPMRATLEGDDGICFSSVDMEAHASDGFGATVLRKGGEHLEFPAPITPQDAAWTTILAELERGADVSLSAGPMLNAMSIDVSHQPEGSNHFPDPEGAARYPRVALSWRCPRPTQTGSARALGMVASDLLERAGAFEGHLGGVAYAAGKSWSPGHFETSYESLIGTRMKASTPEWLRTHVRSPGHRVLVPSGAAVRLGATPDVERKDLAHGVLLSAKGDDPFTTPRDAIERAVLPLVGAPADASD